jgi:hypothetical protein
MKKARQESMVGDLGVKPPTIEETVGNQATWGVVFAVGICIEWIAI